ncbi:hypothetical protein ACFX1Q_035199 [Malus domestica]
MFSSSPSCSSLASHSFVFLSQPSALHHILSTGNLCRIRTVPGLHLTLKESCRDLFLFKFKSCVVVLFIVFGLLNSLFEGKAMDKLPFKLVRAGNFGYFNSPLTSNLEHVEKP